MNPAPHAPAEPLNPGGPRKRANIHDTEPIQDDWRPTNERIMLALLGGEARHYGACRPPFYLHGWCPDCYRAQRGVSRIVDLLREHHGRQPGGEAT